MATSGLATAAIELTPGRRFGSKTEIMCVLAKLVPRLFKLLPFKDESKILEPLTTEQTQTKFLAGGKGLSSCSSHSWASSHSLSI